MAKLLGIDVGTSGARALLIDEAGRVLRQSSAAYPISTPRPLWSEQNPEDWWQGVCRCIEAIGERQVDAIGITGQMHGSVFLDARDEVIRPAILWNDQRTAAECAEIDAAVGRDKVRQITCNPPLTGFQLPKILWLRNHELSGYQRLRSVLLPKDFIRFKLTGVKATEHSDASGVGLLDVPNRTWSGEMMGLLELDPSLFPPTFESEEPTGQTRATSGIEAGIPVVGGGGDQAAAGVGTGAVAEGILSVSLGTSGVVFTALDEPLYDPNSSVHTFCHANGKWHAMGVMLACGGALRWFRDTFHPGKSYDEVAELAAGAPPGCEGLTFLPYLTGERCPHNDPAATAAFAGLTLGHGPAHLARSVFEGISFGLVEANRELTKLGAAVREIRVTGGGAKSPFWLQMLADLLDSPCVIPEVDEGPAYGAAILAGAGIGLWPSVESACADVVRFQGVTHPQGTEYWECQGRFADLYASIRDWKH
ncbi:MAG: xylulokinase [Fimbriimonadaceae bacterium]